MRRRVPTQTPWMNGCCSAANKRASRPRSYSHWYDWNDAHVQPDDDANVNANANRYYRCPETQDHKVTPQPSRLPPFLLFRGYDGSLEGKWEVSFVQRDGYHRSLGTSALTLTLRTMPLRVAEG
jgi:hypothetical protein